MSAVLDARNRLADTLAKSGIRVLLDVGRSPDTPCLMVPLPTLTYDAYFAGPTTASFRVPLVVQAEDHTNEQLLTLLPAVEQAVHDSDDAAMAGPAEPGSWGTPPLPCYLLTIEVSV
jgi:hypothetical protein